MPSDNTTEYAQPVTEISRVVERIMSRYKSDPAFDAQGAPPNYGQAILPHTATFAGLVSSPSQTYRISDEALKNSRDNAYLMEFDIGILECTQARNRSVALLNWHIEPEDASSTEQKDLCDDLAKILKRTPRFMQLRETLGKAVWNGRYATALRYGWQEFNSRMLVAPTEWKPVHGDKLVFRMDSGRDDIDPNQVGIRIGMSGSSIKGIKSRWDVETTDQGLAYFLSPWERHLIAIHKHQLEDGHYEVLQDAGRIHGVGIRSQIYWEWFQKQEVLRWLMEYLERSAFGVEVWYYPQSNPAAKAAMEAAAKARIGSFRNVLLFPYLGDEQGHNQYSIDHLETGMAGVEALVNLLDKYFGHRIKRLIIGQTLTSESEGGGLGSDGIAQVHLETFKDIVRYDATNLEETITTEILNHVKRWNYKRANHFNCRFVIETENIESNERLTQAKMAWEMGARISEKQVLEAIDLTVPGPDDRTLMNPQIAQAEQQQQMMEQQMHQQRAGGTALGKMFNDSIRAHQQQTGIADAGQRSIMGDHFDAGIHKHAMAQKLDVAIKENNNTPSLPQPARTAAISSYAQGAA